jgi:hypothetical protein
MAKRNGFVVVPDSDILNVWECQYEYCNAPPKERRVEVDPTFYNDNGTPLCECGTDMSYVHTLVRK